MPSPTTAWTKAPSTATRPSSSRTCQERSAKVSRASARRAARRTRRRSRPRRRGRSRRAPCRRGCDRPARGSLSSPGVRSQLGQHPLGPATARHHRDVRRGRGERVRRNCRGVRGVVVAEHDRVALGRRQATPARAAVVLGHHDDLAADAAGDGVDRGGDRVGAAGPGSGRCSAVVGPRLLARSRSRGRGRVLAHRLSLPGTQPDLAVRVVDVEVDQADALPGPQHEATFDDRYRRVRRDQRRHHVRPSVAGRAVAVSPAVVGRAAGRPMRRAGRRRSRHPSRGSPDQRSRVGRRRAAAPSPYARTKSAHSRVMSWTASRGAGVDGGGVTAHRRRRPVAARSARPWP